MQTVHLTPSLALSTASVRDLTADLLIVPVFEDEDFAGIDGLDAATGGEIADARERGELTGKPFELFLTPRNPKKHDSLTLKSRVGLFALENDIFQD